RTLTQGGHNYAALLQATANALGLKFPTTAFGIPSDPPLLSAALDNRLFTVMSQNAYSGFGGFDAMGPDQLDIQALQALYGLASVRTGNTVYGFNASADTSSHPEFNFALTPTPVITIVDSGGNNTLDLSGFSSASTVNLSGFSSVAGLTNN